MWVVEKCMYFLSSPSRTIFSFQMFYGEKGLHFAEQNKKSNVWRTPLLIAQSKTENVRLRERGASLPLCPWEICYKSNGENITPFPLPAALIWLFLFCNHSYFLLNFAVVCVFSEGNCIEQRWQINFSLITVKLSLWEHELYLPRARNHYKEMKVIWIFVLSG